MPSDRTTVTELGTGLGMLGLADVDESVRSRTPVMHSLSPEMWERLERFAPAAPMTPSSTPPGPTGGPSSVQATGCGVVCPR